ncbi:AAA family ATPase [Anabaena minutissima FACHB-250]|nr:AAA family ATPase [Anabaena minutissima FACHB-250]
MTQGIYSFPQSEHHFDTVDNKLPPHNIEAEEAVLGGILLDPNAIYRIKDRLKPEHFYITAHKDIYQACLRLCKKDCPNDLMAVTNWLTDNSLLTRIGGRNKLATLVDRTVSAVNIDALASIIIDKAVRRQLIRTLNEGIHLAYDTKVELPEVLSSAHNKVRSIVEIPAPTKDDHQRWKHDRLLSELTEIYTGVPEPSLRFLKLKDLADDHRVSMGFLEHFYLKSLTAQCSKLLTYEELKQLAGSTVREWLLNGLVPKSTTILLASDGGVGKTKLAYGIGKILIQGTNFGPFQSTGEKRRILYYQGDESEGDMLQALETLGYSEDDINKYVRVRFGWSAEAMATLIQDLKDFQPELVFIDSLSTANRFSVYRESEMEYARPILEMTGLANQYKCTFCIIHHMNKGGEVRGTTAIRNAVSEVWQLSKDNSQQATPYDRILEIDKSRSRSSGKKYRLMFSPEDLSFTFLGEEADASEDGLMRNAKAKALDFLALHRNIRFTSEEIAHRLGNSKDYARRYMNELSADGLVSVQRKPGKPNTYYLVYEGGGGSDPGSPKDHPSDHLASHSVSHTKQEIQPISNLGIKKIGSPQDHPKDHPLNLDTVSDTAKGDLFVGENPEKTVPEQNFANTPTQKDHLSPKPLPDIALGGDPWGDPSTNNVQNILTQGNEPKSLPDNDSELNDGVQHGGDPGVILSASEGYEEVKDVTNLNIEVGRVYWSRSLKKQVRVAKIYPSVKKADVNIAGDPTQKPRLPFFDLLLSPIPPSPGDEVEVLTGEHKGKVLIVSSICDGEFWLKSPKAKGFSKPYGPFTANQLRERGH